MALDIPFTGLQLEEDFTGPIEHLPTQAFILDLDDNVIDDMIISAKKGFEIRLSLGNTPTFICSSASHRIEPTFEDDTDDIELFLTDASDTPAKAERLPQLAMSLFRKPELGNPWAQYRTSSSEDEDEEYEELGSDPEFEPEDVDQLSNEELDSDIVLLRSSLAQKEVEKMEKSAKVIEKSSSASSSKSNTRRTASSTQKASCSGRSPHSRASLSPHPTSPSLSSSGSPSLLPVDAASQQAADKARQARSPIIHELAFKEQTYDNLWQKYPGSSEAEFRATLEKIADPDDASDNWRLKKKYWRELDVWSHEYASDDERQQAIDNAIRQYDKMRLSTTEPEWEKLLRREERGHGRVLSKVQANIAYRPTAPKNRAHKVDDSNNEPGSGDSVRDDSGENTSRSSRSGEEGGESTASPSPPRPTTATAASKKKMSGREAQEKRFLSTKKKTTSSFVKTSPVKSGAGKASAEKQTKFKSKEFISDSDSTDSELDSARLAPAPRPRVLSTHTKPTTVVKNAAPTAAELPAAISAATKKDRPQKDEDTVIAAGVQWRPANSPPQKASAKNEALARSPTKKRAREQDDDDSSSSSSSSTPLSKRIRPLMPVVKPTTSIGREKSRQPSSQALQHPPPARSSSVAASGNSGKSTGSTGTGSAGSGANGNSSKPKAQTSPAKSSPLASSPPTNASELDLSSEESVPPIGSTNSSKKRKLVEGRRNNALGGNVSGSSDGKTKKRRGLPEALVDKALRFKTYYEKYESLYRDLAGQSNPPKEKVTELLDMHRRLETMKQSIHNEVIRA